MLDDFVNIHKEGAGNSRQTRTSSVRGRTACRAYPDNKIFHQHKLDGLRFYRDLIRGTISGSRHQQRRGQGCAGQAVCDGEDKWRNENEWPLARTKWTPFYISSAGRANSIKGDGKLVMAEPKNETAGQV